LVIIIVIGGIFFMYSENWEFIDAAYFSAATATSVGFGDIFPIKNISIIFNCFYVLFSITLTSLAMRKIIFLCQNIEKETYYNIYKNMPINRNLVNIINKDSNANNNNSIGRSDYILYMLLLSGKLNKTDYKLWFENFQSIDFDNNGILSIDRIDEYNNYNNNQSIPIIQNNILSQIYEVLKEYLLSTFSSNHDHNENSVLLTNKMDIEMNTFKNNNNNR
jgi:hypothetical protein